MISARCRPALRRCARLRRRALSFRWRRRSRGSRVVDLDAIVAGEVHRDDVQPAAAERDFRLLDVRFTFRADRVFAPGRTCSSHRHCNSPSRAAPKPATRATSVLSLNPSAHQLADAVTSSTAELDCPGAGEIEVRDVFVQLRQLAAAGLHRLLVL